MSKKLFLSLLISIFYITGTSTVFAMIDPIYNNFNYCENAGGTNIGWDFNTNDWIQIRERKERNLCKFEDNTVCEIVNFQDGLCAQGEYKRFDIYSIIDPKPNLVIDNSSVGVGGFLNENPTGAVISVLEKDVANGLVGSALFESVYNFDLHTANWVTSDEADYYLESVNVCNKGTAPSSTARITFNNEIIYNIPSLQIDECSNAIIVGFIPVTANVVKNEFKIEYDGAELTKEDNIYNFNLSKNGIEKLSSSGFFYKWDGFYTKMNNETVDEHDLAKINSQVFKDVPNDYKYQEAIKYLKDNGIVNGYSDGTYLPERTLNRAELLKIVIESKYTDEFKSYSSQNCFSDIPTNQWYTEYICYAKEKGIIVGYSDNTFRPAQDIIYVEALKIALITMGYNYDESDPWYKNFVDNAELMDIVPPDVLSYDQPFNRGQMAELIMRILKY